MRIRQIIALLIIIILPLIMNNSLATDTMMGGISVLNASDPSSWNKAGADLYNLSKYNESIQAFDAALNLSPDYVKAWYNKGLALDKLGRYNDSVLAYNMSIEIDPKFAEAWNNKGLALYKLGRYNESIQTYDEALNISPESAVAWYNKGLVLDKLGRYNESVGAYERAIKVNPELEEATMTYNSASNLSPERTQDRTKESLALGRLEGYDNSVLVIGNAIERDQTFSKDNRIIESVGAGGEFYQVGGSGSSFPILSSKKSVPLEPFDSIKEKNLVQIDDDDKAKSNEGISYDKPDSKKEKELVQIDDDDDKAKSNEGISYDKPKTP